MDLLMCHLVSLLLAASCFGERNHFYDVKEFSASNDTESLSYETKESNSLALCSLFCTNDVRCRNAVYKEKSQDCLKYDCDPKEVPARVIVDKSVLLKQIGIDDDMKTCVRQNQTIFSLNPCGSSSSSFYNQKLSQDKGDTASCPSDHVYKDCQEAFECGESEHGEVYQLRPSNSWNQSVEAKCHFDYDRGWTVIQARLDGSVDFYRNWENYTAGFGDVKGEYWIGLEALHHLTQENSVLAIYLEDWDEEIRKVEYKGFIVHGMNDKYRLSSEVMYQHVSDDAGDSMEANRNQQFSTYDQDHDDWTAGNAAADRKGGWWYGSGSSSNLNGPYVKYDDSGDYESQPANTTAVASWFSWRGEAYPYKTIYMTVSR